MVVLQPHQSLQSEIKFVGQFIRLSWFNLTVGLDGAVRGSKRSNGDGIYTTTLFHHNLLSIAVNFRFEPLNLVDCWVGMTSFVSVNSWFDG
mmetsp:Transcript_13610/g.19835  ORF Transcript_13610/g.19835 Transcript_13610/m.19835 type:complete len:91 (-) Transcript_13610:39-311(-)